MRRGAELGFPAAQAQLRILANRGGDDWKGLRRAIDIKAWREAPKARALSREPRVRAFEGVASAAVCEWIIARSRDRLRPALVYDVATGAKAASAARGNSAADFGLPKHATARRHRLTDGYLGIRPFLITEQRLGSVIYTVQPYSENSVSDDCLRDRAEGELANDSCTNRCRHQTLQAARAG